MNTYSIPQNKLYRIITNNHISISIILSQIQYQHLSPKNFSIIIQIQQIKIT